MTPLRLAVIGHPIAHSRSPRIHAAFAAQCGLAVDYQARLAPLDGFEATVQALRSAGWTGCNVTLPFKPEALALAARASARAQLAGSANTLGWDDSGIWADNTDGQGLCADLRDAGFALAGRRVLLLGAGGAAAGVLAPLLEQRPATIDVCNRNMARAQALVQRHAALAASCGVHLQALAQPQGEFDGLVNATSAGLHGAPLQLPPGLLCRGGWALDMVYGAPAQTLLAWAATQGARSRDGLGMLVQQAAAAFALWTQRQPDPAPVLAALRAELEAEGRA